MDVVVRSRKVEISQGLKGLVEEKVSRLSRFLDGMDHAEVIFSEEKNPRIADREVCEVTLAAHGHLVRARAAAADQAAAVDRVLDKLEHQIEKLKGRLVGRSHPRRHGSVNSAKDHQPPDDDNIDESAPRIVKTKRFEIKPMTPEEASLQMDLLGHDFYFFTNSETERAAVVYRRSDGYVGLIDS